MPRTKSVVEPVEKALEAEVESALSGGEAETTEGDWDDDEDVPPLGFDDEAPTENGADTDSDAAEDANEGDSEGDPDDDEDDEDTDTGDTGEGYQVLYTRFRPHRFASVIGQEHNTEPLKTMISKNKVPTALLFTGDRGCGKTTTARLMAMALNCETRAQAEEDRINDPDTKGDWLADPEPCGKCNVCKSVISGQSPVGIEELDAASNRSISDIRNLIASMQLGSLAQRKVYIIDEVHQLGKDAVSALLKTLEEPPKGVVIILCTTDPDKIPETIRSRTVTFRFRTLDVPTMTGLVKRIAKRAKIDITDAQVQNVVKAGRGSPRDTLSALEALNGSTDATHLNDAIVEVAEALADGEVAGVLAELAKAVNNGVAPQELGTGLISYFQNCLYALQAPSLMRVTDAEKESVTEVARKLKSAKIVRLLKELAAATGKMSFSGDARVLLEVTLITVVIPEASDGILGVMDLLDDVLDRMESLEKKVASASLGGGAVSASTGGSLPRWEGVDPEPAKEKAVAEPEADDEPEEKPVKKDKKAKKVEPEPVDDDADDEADDEPEEAPVKKSSKPKITKADLIKPKVLLNEMMDAVHDAGKKSIAVILDAAIDEKDIEVDTWLDEGVPVFTIELIEDDLDRIESKKGAKDFLVEWVKEKGYELELAVLKD